MSKEHHVPGQGKHEYVRQCLPHQSNTDSQRFCPCSRTSVNNLKKPMLR
jgi:hypothetical protein